MCTKSRKNFGKRGETFAKSTWWFREAWGNLAKHLRTKNKKNNIFIGEYGEALGGMGKPIWFVMLFYFIFLYFTLFYCWYLKIWEIHVFCCGLFYMKRNKNWNTGFFCSFCVRLWSVMMFRSVLLCFKNFYMI